MPARLTALPRTHARVAWRGKLQTPRRCGIEDGQPGDGR